MPSKLVSLAVALYVADVHCGGTAESIFPPILTELILSLAGFLTGQNRFSFPLVFIAATLASLLGALLLYGIGMSAGQRGVGGCSTLWALAPLTPDDLSGSKSRIDRHGPVADFSGRLAPMVRSVVAIPCWLPAEAHRPISPDRFRQRTLEPRACLIGLSSRRKLAPS